MHDSRMPGTNTSEKSWKAPTSGITKLVRSRSANERRSQRKLTDQAPAISKRRRIGLDGAEHHYARNKTECGRKSGDTSRSQRRIDTFINRPRPISIVRTLEPP